MKARKILIVAVILAMIFSMCNVYAFAEETVLAKIGDVEYTDLQEALDAADIDDVITLSENLTEVTKDLTIISGQIDGHLHNASYQSTNGESDDPADGSLFYAPYQNHISSYNIIMGTADAPANITLNGSYIGAGASLLSGNLTVTSGSGLYGSDEIYKSWMNVNVNGGYKIGLGNLLVYGSESDIDVTYDGTTPIAKIDLKSGAEMARFGKIYIGSDQHNEGENAYVLNVPEGASVKEFGELTTRGDGTVNLDGEIDSYATKSYQSSSAAATSMFENAKNGGHINNNGVINVGDTGSIRIDFINIGRKPSLETGNAELNVDGGSVEFRKYINVGYDSSARIGEINLKNGAELISTDSEYTLQYNNGRTAGIETKTQEAGTLTIGVAASGTVTMDASSKISVGSISVGDYGSIVIDASDLDVGVETTVIEQTTDSATSLENYVTVENGDGVTVNYENGDVVLLKTTTAPDVVDPAFGTNNGVIKLDATETDYEVVILATIDSLNYRNVGLEVLFNGQTVNKVLDTVYEAVKAKTSEDSEATEIAPSAFGGDGKFIFLSKVTFGITHTSTEEFSFRPFATKLDGTVIYGKTTIDTIGK